MNLAHMVGLRLLRGAGAGTAAPVDPYVVRGRRRKTRRYRTPTPETLREEYAEIMAAPEARALIGPYVLRGDKIDFPSPSVIDWNALARDAETVVKLFDLYLEHIEEEEDLSVILLGEF